VRVNSRWFKGLLILGIFEAVGWYLDPQGFSLLPDLVIFSVFGILAVVDRLFGYEDWGERVFMIMILSRPITDINKNGWNNFDACYFAFWVIFYIGYRIIRYKPTKKQFISGIIKCPFCADGIKKEAIVCINCGKELPKYS